MKHALVAAAAALVLALAGPAGAESNNLASVETPQTARPIYAGSAAFAGGSEAYPTVATAAVPLSAGPDTLVAATGSEQPVQTAASLPRGFEDGTVAETQARSIAMFMAGRALAARLAGRHEANQPRG